MKTFTVEEVMNALISNNALDYDNAGQLSYYIHITDDGEILPRIDKADKTFTFPVEYTDDNETAWAKESADDKDFMEIVVSLVHEMNEYMEEIQ